MSRTIQQVSGILQDLLINDANQIGRESGFIQRQRKLSGASFAQSLIFGWQANPKASLEELCQSARICGVEISPQGLQERLNSPQANDFLQQLLKRALTYELEGSGVRKDLLASFNGVYIQDSSTVELPALFESQWSAHKSGEAALKVQTLFDYQQGRLRLSLASGRQNDCPLQTVNLPAGSLRLADVGYFKVKVFEQLNANGVFWVSRVPARVGIWTGEKVEHLATWLATSDVPFMDTKVELTAQRFACRLVVLRVPNTVAAQRQQRVLKDAQDRPKSDLKPETLDFCNWTILITNLDSAQWTAHELLCLLKLRWQIELLFKLWKNDLSLDSWRSRQPYQILSEVYAKLLLALVQHWLLVVSCWDVANRSCVKATHLLRKHAFHLLSSLSHFDALCYCLHIILPTLQHCLIQKRKARPATFQFLARSFP